MTPPLRPHLHALTGLRFPAALLVVCLHGAFMLGGLPAPLQRVVGAGQGAVTLFFILSGFILVYTYARLEGGPALRTTRSAFWQARFARVYPVYALGLALSAPFFVSWWAQGGLNRSGPATAVLAPLLLHSWLPQTACVWNCPGWSISAEAFFYLLFPLLLPWTLRRAGSEVVANSALLVNVILLPGCMVFALGLPAAAQDLAADTLYYSPLFRLPEFVLVMLLGAHVLRRPAAPGSARRWLWGGLVGTLALTQVDTLLPNNVRLALMAPFLAALIWGAAGGQGRLARVLAAPLAVYLGEISYSVYILHAPLLDILKVVRGRWWPEVPWHAGWFAVYLLALLLLSALTYRFLERPAQAALRRAWPRLRRRPA